MNRLPDFDNHYTTPGSCSQPRIGDANSKFLHKGPSHHPPLGGSGSGVVVGVWAGVSDPFGGRFPH